MFYHSFIFVLLANFDGLIMECICIVSYSILVNGESKGLITPSRGLR